MDTNFDPHMNKCPWDTFRDPHVMICVHCSIICDDYYGTFSECRHLCPLYALKAQALPSTTVETILPPKSTGITLDPSLRHTCSLEIAITVNLCIVLLVLFTVLICMKIKLQLPCKRVIKNIHRRKEKKSQSDRPTWSEIGTDKITNSDPEASSIKYQSPRCCCLKWLEKRKRKKDYCSSEPESNKPLNNAENQESDSSSFDSGKGPSVDSGSSEHSMVIDTIIHLENETDTSDPNSQSEDISRLSACVKSPLQVTDICAEHAERTNVYTREQDNSGLVEPDALHQEHGSSDDMDITRTKEAYSQHSENDGSVGGFGKQDDGVEPHRLSDDALVRQSSTNPSDLPFQGMECNKAVGDPAKHLSTDSCHLEQSSSANCNNNACLESGSDAASSTESIRSSIKMDRDELLDVNPLEIDGELRSSLIMQGNECSKADSIQVDYGTERDELSGKIVTNQEHSITPYHCYANSDNAWSEDCIILSKTSSEQQRSPCPEDSDVDIMKNIQSRVTSLGTLPSECSYEAQDLNHSMLPRSGEIIYKTGLYSMAPDSVLSTESRDSYKKETPNGKKENEHSLDDSDDLPGVSIRDTSISCRSLAIQERESSNSSCDTIPKFQDSGYSSEQASSWTTISSLDSMHIRKVKSNSEVDLAQSAQSSLYSAYNLTLHSDGGGPVEDETSPNQPANATASIDASTDAWSNIMRLYECIEAQLFRFPWVVGCMITTRVMEVVLNLANYQLNKDTAREHLCQHIPQNLWGYLEITEEAPGVVLCCATYGAGGKVHELDGSGQRGRSASTTLIGLADGTSYAFTVGHLLTKGQDCQIECNNKKLCDDRFVKGSCLESVDTATTFMPKDGAQKNITHKLYDLSLVRMCRPVSQANGATLRYKDDTPVHVVVGSTAIDLHETRKLEVLVGGSSDGAFSRGKVMRCAMYRDSQKFAMNYLEISSTDKAFPFHIEPGRSGSLVTTLPDENNVAKALAYVLGHKDGDSTIGCAAPLWEAMDRVCKGSGDLLKQMLFHDFNPDESGFTSH